MPGAAAPEPPTGELPLAIPPVVAVVVAHDPGEWFGETLQSLADQTYPDLSVLIVTASMTAPMTAWMLYRGMPRRAIAEMSAVMPIVAIVLVGLSWLGVLPKDELALLEHGLMMPAMLIPMLLRLDLYTGRVGNTMHVRHAAGQQ